MWDKILAIITDCRALAAQVATLRNLVKDLERQLEEQQKGRADAEAAAQALKDELAAAVSGFTPSGN